EPIDDMDQPAWQRELLDWLAEDLVAHHYAFQRTLEGICTAGGYPLTTGEGPKEKEAFVFRGPLTRRLSAEQLSDAISALTGEWSRIPSSFEFDFRASGLVEGVQMPKWIWTDEPLERAAQRSAVRSANAKLGDAAAKLGA